MRNLEKEKNSQQVAGADPKSRAAQLSPFKMDTKRLIRFVEVMEDWYDHYAPEIPIGDSFREIAAQIAAVTEKQQIRDLKYIISDFGEMFADSVDQLPEFDDFFTSRGSISVSELVMLYKGGMKKILKRKKLRNEDEAIAVNGLLSQMDTDLSDDDRKALTLMIEQYEKNIT